MRMAPHSSGAAHVFHQRMPPNSLIHPALMETGMRYCRRKLQAIKYLVPHI